MAEGQGRSSNQGVKLLYIRDYLRKYTDKEHPKSATDIKEFLASKGIKADRKTIYNDILRLQMDFQEPIEYNKQKLGYYITQPQFTAKELRMLVDCVQLSSLITKEESCDLVEKILGLGTVYSKENLEKNTRKRTDINKPESSVFQNIETINEAISHRKKIRFRFVFSTLERDTSNNSVSDELIIVNPKYIRSVNGYYYLVVSPDERHDHNYGVSIDRMADIKILSLDIENLPAREFSSEVYRSPLVEREEYTFDPNREYAVTILFHKADIKKVKQRFGNDIVLIPYDDDNMMLTIHTKLSYSFFRTILDFGEHAKILSPKEAIGEFFEYIKKGMKEMNELYGYGSPEFLADVPTNYDALRAQQHKFKHTRRIRKRK